MSLLNEILWLSIESWNVIESKMKLLKTALVWYCLFSEFWLSRHVSLLCLGLLFTRCYQSFFSCDVTCNTTSFVLNVFLGFIWMGNKTWVYLYVCGISTENSAQAQPGLFWERVADTRLWRCWHTCTSLSSEGVHQPDLCLCSLMISGGSGSSRGTGIEHLT